MSAVKLEKLTPEDLWKLLIDDVNFHSKFNLTGELKDKADEELANMKRDIMKVANEGGYRNEGLKVVDAYNRTIDALVSSSLSQTAMDQPKLVLNESIPAFMQRLKDYIRVKNYSYQTELTYLGWVKKYIEFNGNQHPAKLNHLHIEAYLNYLVNRRGVALSTQKQAFNSVMFVYNQFLKIKLAPIDSINKSRKPKKLPTVLSVEEVKLLFTKLDGLHLLISKLLYGTGLRISECMNLRIKDIDFNRNEIFVFRGKGAKDRYVPLPKSLVTALRQQVTYVENLYLDDVDKGYGVILPEALKRKARNYQFDMGWYFLFSSPVLTEDVYSEGTIGRFHLHESVVQRALRQAGKDAGILKRVYPHILRHSYCTHSLMNGVDIKTLQMIMGHSDLSTTEVYLHLADLKVSKTPSPLDILGD